MWDGTCLYLARIESGLTQAELAEYLGMDEAEVFRWQREAPPPDMRAVIEVWMASLAQ